MKTLKIITAMFFGLLFLLSFEISFLFADGEDVLCNNSIAYDSINNVYAVAGVKYNRETGNRLYIRIYNNIDRTAYLLAEQRIPEMHNTAEDSIVRSTFRNESPFHLEPRPIRTSTGYIQYDYDATDPNIRNITYPSLKLVYNRFTQTFMLIITKKFYSFYGDVVLCYAFRYDAYNRRIQGWNEPRLLSRVVNGESLYRAREVYHVDVNTTEQCEYALVIITLDPGAGYLTDRGRIQRTSSKKLEGYLVPMYTNGSFAYHYNINNRLKFIDERPDDWDSSTRCEEFLYASGAISRRTFPDAPGYYGVLKISILYSFKYTPDYYRIVDPNSYLKEFYRLYEASTDFTSPPIRNMNFHWAWERYTNNVYVWDDGTSRSPILDNIQSFYPGTTPLIRINPSSGQTVISYISTLCRNAEDIYYNRYQYGVKVINFDGFNITALADIPRPNTEYRDRTRSSGATVPLSPVITIINNSCILTFQEYYLGEFELYYKIIPLSGGSDTGSYERLTSVNTSDVFNISDNVVRNEVVFNGYSAMCYWNTFSINRYIPARFDCMPVYLYYAVYALEYCVRR